METLLTCGRYYDAEQKMWRNCWHPPAVCIGCDSIRHTRSAAAGLKTRTSYGKLPPEISRIIFTFVDWEEVYEANLQLLYVHSHSEAIHRPKRMPSSIELQAYAAAIQIIHGHRSVWRDIQQTRGHHPLEKRSASFPEQDVVRMLSKLGYWQ